MIFTLTRACKCKLRTNEFLETSRIKLKFVSENVYDKQKARNDKSSRQLSLWQQDGGQPDEGQNEQQQQPVNHSSDNAEIACCLTPFSHPGIC